MQFEEKIRLERHKQVHDRKAKKEQTWIPRNLSEYYALSVLTHHVAGTGRC